MDATDLVAAINNLNSAADELRGAAEGVADAIETAVQQVEDAAGNFDLEEAEGDDGLDDLIGLVERLHEEEHNGAQRWCSREVCRFAHELRQAVAS